MFYEGQGNFALYGKRSLKAFCKLAIIWIINKKNKIFHRAKCFFREWITLVSGNHWHRACIEHCRAQHRPAIDEITFLHSYIFYYVKVEYQNFCIVFDFPHSFCRHVFFIIKTVLTLPHLIYFAIQLSKMTEVQLQEFKLDPDCELRFEVESKNEKVVLEV